MHQGRQFVRGGLTEERLFKPGGDRPAIGALQRDAAARVGVSSALPRHSTPRVIVRDAARANGKGCAIDAVVTWLTWLIIVLLVATFAALTGITPTGARPVANTRLMGMARLVLIVVVLVLAFIAFRARSGG